MRCGFWSDILISVIIGVPIAIGFTHIVRFIVTKAYNLKE